jgi:hypothetical protein
MLLILRDKYLTVGIPPSSIQGLSLALNNFVGNFPEEINMSFAEVKQPHSIAQTSLIR